LEPSDSILIKIKVKISPTIGCGDLWGCNMLRIPDYLDSGLRDGGEVVRFMHWPHCTPQKHILFQPLVFIAAGG
jgi:hypothetical protein